MIIGVDADGVLTDMSAYIYEYGERYFKKKPVCPDGYSTAKIFGVTDKEEFKFGLRYFFTYCKKWPPRENAVFVNQKLNADGHTLYEITARKFVMMKNPLGLHSRNVFRRWLKRHGFHFNDIVFCSEDNTPADKLKGCQSLSVDVMIDDKPDVALFLAENDIKVILFDTPYNQNIEHKNITRVFNWNEIYKVISKTY